MNIERHAVRAVVLSPEREVLLIDFRPTLLAYNQLWLTPGGGIEAGETSEQALRRELEEELGLTNAPIGPLLARMVRPFTTTAAALRGDTRRLLQHEEYFVVEQPRFEPRMLDAVEAADVAGFRWWGLSELSTTRDVVVPRTLAPLIAAYYRDGARVDVGLEIDTAL